MYKYPRLPCLEGLFQLTGWKFDQLNMFYSKRQHLGLQVNELRSLTSLQNLCRVSSQSWINQARYQKVYFSVAHGRGGGGYLWRIGLIISWVPYFFIAAEA